MHWELCKVSHSTTSQCESTIPSRIVTLSQNWRERSKKDPKKFVHRNPKLRRRKPKRAKLLTRLQRLLNQLIKNSLLTKFFSSPICPRRQTKWCYRCCSTNFQVSLRFHFSDNDTNSVPNSFLNCSFDYIFSRFQGSAFGSEQTWYRLRGIWVRNSKFNGTRSPTRF